MWTGKQQTSFLLFQSLQLCMKWFRSSIRGRPHHTFFSFSAQFVAFSSPSRSEVIPCLKYARESIISFQRTRMSSKSIPSTYNMYKFTHQKRTLSRNVSGEGGLGCVNLSSKRVEGSEKKGQFFRFSTRKFHRIFKKKVPQKSGKTKKK